MNLPIRPLDGLFPSNVRTHRAKRQAFSAVSVERSHTTSGSFMKSTLSVTRPIGLRAIISAPFQRKCLFHSFGAGMEQPGQLSRLRIDPGDVGPFMPIAVQARKSQIIEAVRPAVLFGDDVVDLEGRRMQRGRRRQYSRTPSRPFPETPNCVGVHFALFFLNPQAASGFGLHHRDQIAHVNITVKLSRVRRGQRSEPGQLAQLIHSRDVMIVESQR